MRWTCPHCTTQLNAAEPNAARSWFYVRCSKCSGYAMVERATGRALRVETAAAEPLPPPAPVVASAAAPAQGRRPARLAAVLAVSALGATALIIALQGTRATTHAPSPSQAKAQVPAQAAPKPAPVVAAAPLAAPLSDSIHQSASAPVRITPSFLVARLRPRALADELRSGPGHDFEVVGHADASTIYHVLEWHDRWFHVAWGDRTAWIHYDALELFSR